MADCYAVFKNKLIIKFITISNTGKTLGFEQKDLVREEYNDDVHPLYLYLLGDKEMRSDVMKFDKML